MHARSCSFCLEWTTSDQTVVEALRGRWRASQGCPHQPHMRVAIEQLRKNVSTWWVVEGTVVVPIWTVEIIKKRARLVSVPHPESQTFVEVN